MKLDIRAFALAFAFWWGGSVFLLTWWVIATQGADAGPSLLGTLYLGYAVTPLGSLIGLAWGFLDSLIGGAALAWLYNLMAGFRVRSKV